MKARIRVRGRWFITVAPGPLTCVRWNLHRDQLEGEPLLTDLAADQATAFERAESAIASLDQENER